MKFTKPLVAVLLLLAAASVLAAPANRPCREDIQKLCPDAAGERGAIRACIQENFDQLSEQCQVAVNKRREERRSAGGGQQTPPENAGPRADP
ncbi:MAG: cysteine rich repeat-containing protein [Gammaproteobacteria bacterium]|nr:cysteine rich repeat-containing protein [Gammaproteobacteria bacterium]